MNYKYGGDGNRRESDITGGSYHWYNFDGPGNIINEEDKGLGTGDGTLQRYFNSGLSDSQGSNSATADTMYYMPLITRSPAAVYDQNRNIIGTLEYSPHGGAYCKLPHR